MFLAAGLNPVVEWLQRRGVRRGYAVLTVIVGVLVGLTLFGIAIVPVISDQVAALTDQAPGWFDRLQNNRQVQDLDDKYDIVDKAKDYVSSGDYASSRLRRGGRRRPRRGLGAWPTPSSSSC